MGGKFNRRQVMLGAGAVLASSRGLMASNVASGCCGIDYLERLADPGRLHDSVDYIPPSRLHAAYNHAIYVNTAGKGEAAQKMWVLERRGDGWHLALWDAAYWADKGVTGTPPYSWPVSTGRKYSDSPSGPTPTGIFNIDDRNARHRKGWGSPGMYNSIYIDLHYSGGRAAGVAMHGTFKSKYPLLGRIDSHGCVRMTQANADQTWDLFHPNGARGPESPLWGEVPRYFTSTPSPDYTARYGYVRDGRLLYDKAGKVLTKAGYTAVFVFFRDDLL
jgi:hypothetical protein